MREPQVGHDQIGRPHLYYRQRIAESRRCANVGAEPPARRGTFQRVGFVIDHKHLQADQRSDGRRTGRLTGRR
jgi:hypothetical protein